MGAHLSTIQATLKERFTKCDEEGKGHLVRAWLRDHIIQQC